SHLPSLCSISQLVVHAHALTGGRSAKDCDMHALALVCLGLVWVGDGEEESSLDPKPFPRLYSGRTLEDWITTANNPSEEVRAEAMALFGDVGPAARSALPIVQQGLKDKSGLVRVAAAHTLWRIDRY